MAIVEVQKRKKKPDINTFDGWHQKMLDVGAQQLICVSAMGYPKSIIEKVATRIGPTVKLLTLEDLAKSNNLSGFFLLPKMIITNPKFQIQDSTMDLIGNLGSSKIDLDLNAKYFSASDFPERISANDIVSRFLNNTTIDTPPPHELSTSSKSITIVIEDSLDEFWFHHLNCKVRIKRLIIKVNIHYEPQEISIPVINFAYRQQSIDGVLAWASNSKFIHDGQEREINIVLKPDEDGFLSNISWDIRLVGI